ncbi:MAG: hypothetical protein JXB23_18960, partial [Candidatus Aminicenantes bacterium]|nr:hypothetical protein [Candidatus Aminicenantes bacterium]
MEPAVMGIAGFYDKIHLFESRISFDFHLGFFGYDWIIHHLIDRILIPVHNSFAAFDQTNRLTVMFDSETVQRYPMFHQYKIIRSFLYYDIFMFNHPRQVYLPKDNDVLNLSESRASYETQGKNC